MLVLSMKPLQELTGTGGQTDGQANLCVGRLRLQKQKNILLGYYSGKEATYEDKQVTFPLILTANTSDCNFIT